MGQHGDQTPPLRRSQVSVAFHRQGSPFVTDLHRVSAPRQDGAMWRDSDLLRHRTLSMAAVHSIDGSERITLAPPTLAHPPGAAHLPGGIESTRPLRRSVVGALANQPRRVDPVHLDTPHRAGTLRFHYIGLMLIDATFAVSGFLLYPGQARGCPDHTRAGTRSRTVRWKSTMSTDAVRRVHDGASSRRRVPCQVPDGARSEGERLTMQTSQAMAMGGAIAVALPVHQLVAYDRAAP